MLTLYYLGSEIPGHRKFLAEQGVSHVGLSFVGLSRRVKFSKPWLISEKYPDTQRVLLDSGGYTIRAHPEKYDEGQLDELASKYISFVEANAERAELVVDLDIPGFEDVSRMLSELAGDKYLPIWHQDDGLDHLAELAATYGRVGVPQTSVSGRDITSELHRLADRGYKLHGVAMTQTAAMAEIPWDSVASTSWLSPTQFGDSQIWTGSELKRYPKKYKERGRRAHRAYLEENGFDVDAYEADDVYEVKRVSVWSWERFVASINERKQIVTMRPNMAEDENSENGLDEVGAELVETRNEIQTRDPNDRMLLPGLSLSTVRRAELGEDGDTTTQEDHLVGVSSASLRQCDSCYIRQQCLAYKPNSTCAYEIPVTLRTRDQLMAARDAVLAMQFQRIAFMRAAEEAKGGFPDANLTKELALWEKMVSKRVEEESDIEKITITATRRNSAGAGRIAQLFGEKASERARELESPMSSDDVIEASGIVDAEIIE